MTRVMRLATAATQSADPADWPRAGDVLGGRVWGLEKGGRVPITTDRCLVLLGERPDSSDGQLKRVEHAQPAPASDDEEKARFMAARKYTVELLKEVRRNAAVRLAAHTAGLLTACRALLKAEKEAERVGEVGLHMDLLFTHGPVDWRDRLPTFDEADEARAALLATLGVTFERPHDPEACHSQVDRAVQAVARLHGKVYGHLVELERIQLAGLLEHVIAEADVYWCPRRWLSGAGPSTATLKPWLAFFTPESEMPSEGEAELRNMCEAALERILREQACNVPKEEQASTAREWQPPPDTEAYTLQRWQALLACAGRETAVRAVVEALRERRDATWQEHRDLWKSGTGPNCMDLEDPSGRGSGARYLQAMLRDALNASISGAVAHLIDAKGAAEGSISKRLRERAARTADIARDCREGKGPASRTRTPAGRAAEPAPWKALGASDLRELETSGAERWRGRGLDAAGRSGTAPRDAFVDEVDHRLQLREGVLAFWRDWTGEDETHRRSAGEPQAMREQMDALAGRLRDGASQTKAARAAARSERAASRGA